MIVGNSYECLHQWFSLFPYPINLQTQGDYDHQQVTHVWFIHIRKKGICTSWTMSSVIGSSEINHFSRQTNWMSGRPEVFCHASLTKIRQYNGHEMRGGSPGFLKPFLNQWSRIWAQVWLIWMAIFSSHHELTLPRIMQTQSSGNRSVLPVNATCFITNLNVSAWLQTY